ncbi:MAG: YidC/Oxa1 family membrane protein insertase [Candidatus Peribacteraceae bacterium]|nr:YidC/Oxa1 family membrane protein insertase [Candidatus Peribacteraceae bacterium]MDD5075217.1 YidC/Oxa1 family membrane protein insertase [Candidatus Peribacteraceae bacterium]
MSEQKKKRGSLLEFVAIFAIVYLLTQFAFRTFLPQKNTQNETQGIELKSTSAKVKGDHDAILSLENKTNGVLTLPDRCPMPPVEVYRVEGAGSGESVIPLMTTETALPCIPLTTVAAGEKATINLAAWKYSLFSQLGAYEVRLPKEAAITGTGGTVAAPSVEARFTLVAPGTLTRIFRAFITKPFLNFLIFIASILPNHSLGIAIIVLTILVKLLLFIPTQHALEGQKKMQKAQPHLDEIRRRFKDDPKRMQEETMKVWKEHKINPFQSCLPTLVQLPVLIGLFYVIRDGSVLATSRHLIYEPYLHLAWTFNTQFIGFDLLKPSVFVFPPLLVLLQFLQMKLTFAINDRKKKVQQGDKPAPATDSSQKMQQNMMLYGLPLMIGVFAYQFPAAVSLYWGVSTLFAIGQQIIVNREKITG